ncbi:hypothetical protein I302_106164 [Kwoniella bestiolae CBS 10118]|uniref:Uncharacterized protein n=1 Tax=Kwoniella bestiolae CBS 10118 TaxID=1296100 RepID=A0A1B9G352_9TREE|nr:hypothetical protein I302_05287 [Kwoniella bestiolae CBS 10118]OCF25467.1 hypothetical protein I302_05287 [Kwoniella bestiolae CBS 10118]
MSRPINAYAPDPNGWIDTAPSSSRRPTQRPLVSFNHGIATPLSSGYKPSSGRGGPGPGPKTSENIRKRLNDKTPITKDRQGTLNRYLHTPLTVSDKKRERESRVPLSDKDTPLHPQTRGGLIFGNGKKQDKVKEASRLKVRDDSWGSEEEQEETLETRETRRKDEKEKRDVLNWDLPPIRQKPSGKKDNIEPKYMHTKTNDRHLEKSSPRKRRSKMTEEVIPPSLPPPAQSTRSHDISPASPSQQNYPRDMQRTPMAQMTKSAYKESSPAQFTRSRQVSASPRQTRKSPSLPPLTPSLPPEFEPETEPTQPRAFSLSPGPFDRLSQHERTPPHHEASSPPLQITPVPEWVQYNHRQMNHRNQSQLDAIPSPWAKRDRSEPGHVAHEAPCSPQAGDGRPNQQTNKRKRDITKEEEINRRVWMAAHEKRHRTPSPGSKGKRLVDLSSSDPPEPTHEDDENPLKSPPHETPSKKLKTGGARNEARKALTPMKPNALRGTISSSNIGRNPSQRSSLLTTPRRRAKKGPALVSPLPRTSVMQRNEERERERSLSPSPVKSTSKAFPRLSGKSPSPEQFTNRIDEMEEREQLHSRLNKMNDGHRGSEPPLTPQKVQVSPKKYPHHQITPPKSHRPKMSERQETLFVLPDPPIRPHFPMPTRGADHGLREWKVAEMQPETLLDWGLEPEDGDQDENDIPEQADDNYRRPEEGRNESQSPEPPLFSPNASPEKERRPSLGHRWSSKSIEPTTLSQDFPRLIPSSPAADEQESPARSSPKQLSSTEKTPQAGPCPSQGKAKWDHLQRGILATTPVPNANANASTPSQVRKSTPKDSQKNKKRKSNSTTDRNEQSKLASFGFFNDKSNRKLNREFEKRWEDEEDLDLDIPDDEVDSSPHDQEGKAKRGDNESKGKKLGKVPEAPYHPSLRPAGIREMERRERARIEPQSPSTPKRKDILSSPDRGDEREAPLFDVHHSSSLTGSSLTSSSMGKTPGSTRDWWDGLGKRRGSEFGTME